MEVKELVELLKTHNRKHNEDLIWIELFETGEGMIRKGVLGEGIFSFENVGELIRYLKLNAILEKQQKPPDYKSLFSMMDGELHPELQEFLKSLMEDQCSK